MAQMPVEGSEVDQPPMSNDEGKKDGMPGTPEEAGPEAAQKSLLVLGQSLNQLKAGLSEAGLPPEALSKLEDAAQSYMDFLDMMTGNAKPQMGGQVPEAAQGGKNVVPADSMSMGRKGAKPMMG